MAWSYLVLPLVATLLIVRRRSPLAACLLDLRPRRFRPSLSALLWVVGLLALDFGIVRGLGRSPARADAASFLALDATFLSVTFAIGCSCSLSNRAWLVMVTGVDVVLLIVFAVVG